MNIQIDYVDELNKIIYSQMDLTAVDSTKQVQIVNANQDHNEELINQNARFIKNGNFIFEFEYL